VISQILKKIFLFIIREKEWKWDGFSSERAYKRYYDPKIWKQAYTVSEFYRGYPHVIKCNYESRIKFLYSHEWENAELSDWLDDNCMSSYRFDFHRVSGCEYYGKEDYIIDEMGGGDYVFAAFVNEQDAVLFALTWN
jgi:hypothetical protein